MTTPTTIKAAFNLAYGNGQWEACSLCLPDNEQGLAECGDWLTTTHCGEAAMLTISLDPVPGDASAADSFASIAIICLG